MKKIKSVFLCLVALFVVPFVGAWLLFFSGKSFLHKTTNHGELLLPPKDFNQLTIINMKADQSGKQVFHHKWLLVYYHSGDCKETCLRTLYKIRQTHIALGKDQNRVLRILLNNKPLSNVEQNAITTQYSGTALMVSNSSPLEYDKLYVVDPLGNIMMAYPQDIAFKSLLSDLKRLLQISQIG